MTVGEDIGKGRYIWAGDGRGIWDNANKCWVVWKTMGGTWECGSTFKRLVMCAINADPGLNEYRISDV